jgi:hypothetical protein
MKVQDTPDRVENRYPHKCVRGKMFLPECGRDVLLSHGNDVFHQCGYDVFLDYGKKVFQ